MAKKEKTLVIIKPDGVLRGLVGKIIDRYEVTGLKIAAMKMLQVDEALVKVHYPDSMATQLGDKAAKSGAQIEDVVEHGKRVLNWLRSYISSDYVVAIVLEGDNAIQLVRSVTGYTDPQDAKKGTIRGDFGIDSILQATKEQRVVHNLVHASGNKEEADREIELWFGS